MWRIDADCGIEEDTSCGRCSKEFYYYTETKREYNSLPAIEYLNNKITRALVIIANLDQEASKESDEGRRKWLIKLNTQEEVRLKCFKEKLECFIEANK